MERKLVGISLLLASSISLSNSAFSDAPVNSVQDSRIISGGTFTNTADSKTTFINSAGGGLWLKSGSVIRGVEVDSAGKSTNNGGTIQFYAPQDVVRIDGKVDVSGLQNGQGLYLGNGGHVFVDAAYLYQGGTILANGHNGGLVQVNVAGANLTPTAIIEAKGLGGNGGVVSINATGPVVTYPGSVIDSSGKVTGTFDTNVINIEGGVVIKDGLLRADGVDSAYGGSHGGTIRLVATGQSDLEPIQDAWTRATTGMNPIMSSDEKLYLGADASSFVQYYDGDVTLYGNGTASTATSANGTRGVADPNNDYTQNAVPRAGDGGTILVSAVNTIDTGSPILANGAIGTRNADGTPVQGGNGGTIALIAGKEIVLGSSTSLQADGGRGGWSSITKGADSGDGGLIVTNTPLMISSVEGNPIYVSASGGQGGDGLQPGHGGNGGLIAFNDDLINLGNADTSPIKANGGQGGDNSAWAYGGRAGTIISPFVNGLPLFMQQGSVNGKLVSNSV